MIGITKRKKSYSSGLLHYINRYIPREKPDRGGFMFKSKTKSSKKSKSRSKRSKLT